jgi:C4-dicarboxylate-specific signal transduction histidine kinase
MAEADAILVEVDDSGPGIPSILRNKLFQPFATAKHNGLGLGLILSATLSSIRMASFGSARSLGPERAFASA